MQTGSTVQLVTHVWRTKYAWYVVVTPPRGRKYVAARGIADRAVDPVDDTYGSALIESALTALRALGE